MNGKKELNAQIGAHIRLARIQAKLTQEQLSEKLDCTAQYISDLERGVVGISTPMLRNLCLTLGISSDSILFSSEPQRDLDTIAEQCRQLSNEQFQLLLEIVRKYIEAVNL